MPAPASCPITVPAGIDSLDVDVLLTTGPSLLQALRTVPDPRDPRGVRHDFYAILALAVCATLTGARGYAALWRWSTQILPATRAALGITGPIPSEKTLRVILQTIEPGALNYAITTWLAEHLEHLRRLNSGETVPANEPVESTAVTVIAVDGKTVRGSRDGDTPGTHLLAAFDTTHGIPLDQVGVVPRKREVPPAKTNEITYLSTLLSQLKDRGLLPDDAIVTADALHTQRSTAAAIVATGADYVLAVKRNHPKLHDHLAALPWASMPTSDSTYDRGHGRLEERHTTIATVSPAAAGAIADFPHAAQVLRLVRRRRKLHQRRGEESIEIVYVLTSIEPGRLSDDVLAGIVRRHWAVENRLHYVRDTAFDEDRCRARTGHGAAILASLRNLAITVLRLLRYDNIRAALEHHAYDRDRPLRTLQRLG